MRDNLGRRGFEGELLCPICGEEPETTVHTLFECEEINRLCYVSPLRMVVKKGDSKSLKE